MYAEEAEKNCTAEKEMRCVAVRRKAVFPRIFLSVALFCALSAGYSCVAAEANITNANVISRNLRIAGLEAYVHGFLGGKSEYLIQHPFVLGGIGREGDVFEMAWLYGVAYPATAWSWSGAVLGSVKVGADDSVEVGVTKPEVNIQPAGRPKSVAEWMYGTVSDKVKTEHVTRKYIIDNSGMMKITPGGYEKMKSSIIADIEEGLKWCLEKKQEAKGNRNLRAHLERVHSENRFSSTVKLPLSAERLLDRVMSEVFDMK